MAGMSINVEKTSLPGVLVVVPRVFRDQRGFFLETFHKEKYRLAGLDHDFVQDNHSRSRKGILRGMHYQLHHPQAKLITVSRGEIFDVAVDIRRGSPSFGKWTGVYLSEQNNRQLFIPEGVAHGFVVLSDPADVTYKCTELYYPEDEHGVIWSDPQIGIEWPILDPVLSDKDRQYSRLSEIPENLLPVYK
jgi:dTDP-4-dehydrorhamnose 3,5-epimerase